MKEEIDELRKKELERSKELEALKVKIEKSEAERMQTALEYTLGFDKNVYLSKGFIESAQWIKNVLAKNMNDKMNEERHRERFETLIISKKPSSHLGIRACARYNCGEECNLGKWHATQKNEPNWSSKSNQFRPLRNSEDRGELRQDPSPKRNELRLHICTLCLEAIGSANGHSVLECPWIMKKKLE
jgi:hypothetical protein